jgi:hypothetical protein
MEVFMKLLGFLKFFAIASLMSFMVACASSGPTMLEIKQGYTEPTLTKSAYENIKPILEELKPGQSMEDTGLSWKIGKILQGGKVVALHPVSDGWAGALSGDLRGAGFKLGEPYSFDGNSLYGQHVYGFITNSGLFVPQYLVQTVSTVLTEEEYNQLESQQNLSIGWTYKPGSDEEKFYFKNVQIHDVRKLLGYEESASELEQGGDVKQGDIQKLAQELYTEARFESAAQNLSKIKKGTDIFTTLGELNGFIAANYGGVNYMVFTDGFLKYKGEYIFQKTTSTGIYVVWPFGYVEADKEVPKLALIYKNGVVHDLIPYTSKSSIAKTLE